MSRGMSTDLLLLARKARKQGWTIAMRRKHVCWTSPGGRKVFTGKTLSDYRAVKNVRAELRRTGEFTDA